MDDPNPEFSGFGPELVPFLRELSENNNREWFGANKVRYERVVREPARAFIRAMGRRLGGISPSFLADDRKVGGSLMRIYRDTRFGRDKTPYKTNLGIQFRHEAGKDVHAPGLYVHIDPQSSFLGAGVWRPPAAALAKIREKIDEEPDRWQALLAARSFARYYEQSGASLKSSPRGYPRDHRLIDELRRTDHIAIHSLDPKQLESPALPDRIRDRFLAARDYVAFICAALDVRF